MASEMSLSAKALQLPLAWLLAVSAWAAAGLKSVLLREVQTALEEGAGHVQHAYSDVAHHFWWVGVLTTMVGATLTVVGLMLQKSSHEKGSGKRCEPGGGEQRPYWLRWRWLLGLLVWLVGQVVCWAADGLANRSLLACFNCWNIAVVFVLSPWCLGESVVPRAAAGAAVTLGGCVWVVLTGPRKFHTQTVQTLQDSWDSIAFLCIVAVSLVAAIALAARARWSEQLAAPFLHVQLAALSAIFAWYAVLLSKCGSTLTMTSVQSKSQLGHWQYWVYLAAMGAFAVCQVHTLNMAMRVGTAISVLPAYESLSMLGQVVICGVFFHEFGEFGTDDFLHFSCAIASVLLGIIIMTTASVGGDAKEQDDCSSRSQSSQPILAGAAQT